MRPARQAGMALVFILAIALVACGGVTPRAEVASDERVPSRCRFELALTLTEAPTSGASDSIEPDADNEVATSWTAADGVGYSLRMEDGGGALFGTKSLSVVATDRDGTERVTAISEDVVATRAPRVRVSGARVLFVWREREDVFESRRLAVFEAGAPAVASQTLAVHPELELTIEEIDGGWLLFGVGRESVQLFEQRGALPARSLAALHGSNAQIVRAHDGFGVLLGRGNSLVFSRVIVANAGAIVSPPRVIDEDFGPAAWLMPRDLIPSDDGWWVFAAAMWQAHHYEAAPPETRFIKLAPDGTSVGRVHHRSGDIIPRDAILRDLRPSGSELVGRFDGTDRGFRVHAAPECAPIDEGPCSPRRFIANEEAPLLQARFGRSRTLRVRHRLGWERSFEGTDRLLEEPYVTGDEARFHLLRGGIVERWTLQASTGATMSVKRLPVGGDAVCSTRRGDPLLVVLGAEEVSVFDVSASPVRVFNMGAAWASCAIDRGEERVYLAGTRIVHHTSAGPVTSPDVLVLNGPADTRLHHHSLELAGGPQLQLLADGDGATMVWSDFTGRHYTTWRLDGEAAPASPPAFLQTLYFFPRISLKPSAAGPVMHWRTWNEEGEVPVCHAAVNPRAHPAEGYRGLGLTLF